MQRVKALSLHNGEPAWLDWILEGRKTIETRTWSTSYRGPLLLVGTKKPENHLSGLAAGMVRLVDCRPMTLEDELAACCPWREALFAWELDAVMSLAYPFTMRGFQRLYNARIPNWILEGHRCLMRNSE